MNVDPRQIVLGCVAVLFLIGGSLLAFITYINWN